MSRRTIWLLVKSSALLTGCLIASCAAARDPTTGEIVVGVGLARLPETGNQLIATGLAAATGIPGAGPLALGALGLLSAVQKGKQAAEASAQARAQSEARVAEKKAWDEATAMAHARMLPPPEVGTLQPAINQPSPVAGATGTPA